MTAHEPMVSEKASRRINRSRTGRRLLAAGIIVGVFAAGIAAFAIILGARSRPPLLSAYTFAAVRRGRLDESIVIAGALHLEGTVPIAAPQAGIVEELFVREGDEADRGDPIARISSDPLDQAILDLELQLRQELMEVEFLRSEWALRSSISERTRRQLMAQADHAAVEAENAVTLRRIGGLSGESVRSAQEDGQAAADRLADHRDQMKLEEIRHNNTVDGLLLDIGMLEKKLAGLKEELSLCRIRSPIRGRVARLSVSRGAYVGKYEPVAVIADGSSPVVIAALPDRYLGSVPPGFEVQVEIAGERLPAVVVGLGAEVRAEGAGAGSVLDLRIALRKKPEWMLEGMAARVTLVVGSRGNTLSLPRGPFFSTGGERCVFKILGNHGVRTEVRFGLVTETEVEVLEGLEEGERIITSDCTDFIDHGEIALDPRGGKGQ